MPGVGIGIGVGRPWVKRKRWSAGQAALSLVAGAKVFALSAYNGIRQAGNQLTGLIKNFRI